MLKYLLGGERGIFWDMSTPPPPPHNMKFYGREGRFCKETREKEVMLTIFKKKKTVVNLRNIFKF